MVNRHAHAPHAAQATVAHTTVAHATPAPAEPNPFLALLADTQAVVSAPHNPFVALLAEAERVAATPSEAWLDNPVTRDAVRRAGLRDLRNAGGTLRVAFFREANGDYRSRVAPDGRRQWFVICSICGDASCSLSHWIPEP